MNQAYSYQKILLQESSAENNYWNRIRIVNKSVENFIFNKRTTTFERSVTIFNNHNSGKELRINKVFVIEHSLVMYEVIARELRIFYTNSGKKYHQREVRFNTDNSEPAHVFNMVAKKFNRADLSRINFLN